MLRPVLVAAILTTATAAPSAAQSSTAPSDAVIHMSGSEIAMRAARLGTDKASVSFPVAEYGGYTVRLEHRTDKPQKASVHETEAELFYVVDGHATIRTGGTLDNPTRDGVNLSAQSISGGTLQELKPGDVLLIPPGVAHWVVKIDRTTNLLSLHLPIRR